MILKSPSIFSKVISPRPKSSLVSPCSRRYPSPLYRPQTIVVVSRDLSNLGLRTNQPPDSLPDPSPESPPEIPDQEWEIRTGRAIYILQETLPEFFKTGLITSINKITGTPRPPSASTPTVNPNFLEPHILPEDDELIYSPNVRLSYTPPVELPPPFPKTFHVEGFQLYLASSSLLRHTMLALYSNLAVQNTKLVINTPLARQSESPPSSSKKRRINREKSILLRQTVTGIARVSGKPGEWIIESTYTFSPITGLIHQHIINSIHPAPHQAVYDTLRLSLSKLLGGAGASPTNGAACKGKIQSGKSGQ
ncbi:hypothetical protein CPB84DRAFT_1674484 [Gymnopilus junonius]|uniref:Uncharacterized protein n=1 Tax=Gymnopilus junonius TaxID=109634 RepID=A0A9P5NW16_GYMJU|nr:hypothetical protein CPB84DRAFT_1674484 [Gymnopilus junonius]